MSKTDYTRALESLRAIPKFHIGQQVKTPDGVGIIVNLHLKNNPLFLEPNNIKATVWYSAEQAVTVRNKAGKWITQEYDLKELKTITI